MSLEAYITFLIRNFHKQPENEEHKVNRNDHTSYSNPWFGVLPFLFKWFLLRDPKN